MCTKLHIFNWKKFLSLEKFYIDAVGSVGDEYQLCHHDPPLGDLLSAICIAGERIIVRFVEDVRSPAITIVAATAHEMMTTKTMTAKYATFSYQMPIVVNIVVMLLCCYDAYMSLTFLILNHEKKIIS